MVDAKKMPTILEQANDARIRVGRKPLSEKQAGALLRMAEASGLDSHISDYVLAMLIGADDPKEEAKP